MGFKSIAAAILTKMWLHAPGAQNNVLLGVKVTFQIDPVYSLSDNEH